MNEHTRTQILKAGMLLAILEGWTSRATVAARVHEDPEPLAWLARTGFVENGGDVVRWAAERTFEDLWDALVPERPCPMRFRCVTPTEVALVSHGEDNV